MDDLYTPHPGVHGFVKGRNTATNAKCHLAKRNLLNIDISNFFETISIESVLTVFNHLGFNQEISLELAKITTLGGTLVQGFNTSPVIANLVADKMDSDLEALCEVHESVYTRYADDISISGDSDLPSIGVITEIISKNGFAINDKKSRYFKRGQKQFVTGLTIFDNQYPRIPKRIKRRIRQELYYIKKYGLSSHQERRKKNGILEGSGKSILMNRLKGWIDYINSIEPKEAKDLYAAFNEAQASEENWRKTYLKTLRKKINSSTNDII